MIQDNPASLSRRLSLSPKRRRGDYAFGAFYGKLIPARAAEEPLSKTPMKSEREGINALAKPSGTGCVECLATGDWWLHLRRCAECGHIGCCDSSPNQHASKHNAATGHPIITSFEPGERWFYDYRTGDFFAGPKLVAPYSHPLDQPVPGPAGRVPSNWQSLVRG